MYVKVGGVLSGFHAQIVKLLFQMKFRFQMTAEKFKSKAQF